MNTKNNEYKTNQTKCLIQRSMHRFFYKPAGWWVTGWAMTMYFITNTALVKQIQIT